jgi:hypothetical protein
VARLNLDMKKLPPSWGVVRGTREELRSRPRSRR